MKWWLSVGFVLVQISTSVVNARCTDYQADKQLLFGDLHVHTQYSLDASTQNTRTTPAQAYQFAKGDVLGIQPWAADGAPLRQLKLDKPLDFAAVTDHAELLGEVNLCQDPEEKAYSSWQCRLYRNHPRAAFFLFNTQSSRAKRLGFCGDDGQYCRQAGLSPWQDIQRAAALAHDSSDNCEFSSFVAYEWTGASENLANLHRNIIFRNSEVPTLPISFIDAPSAEKLWNALDKQCIDAESGCDAIVIPHNSNLSDGFMFLGTREDGKPLDKATAAQRARLERVVEVIQHKGSSECYYGANDFGAMGGEDELCAFEQLDYAKFSDKFLGKILPILRQAPTPDAGYTRDVLGRGLAIEQQLGINPFAFGMIGSTDTHIGAPGAVSEANFPGHGGAGAVLEEGQLPQGLSDDPEYNPGGLAAIWAEENSREAIFSALRRREVYATSGPRIALRFFAAQNMPTDICERADFATQGYLHGVPMGGELDAGTFTKTKPVFAVFAAADSAEGQQKLQRIQIIKGSVDGDGVRHEQVIDVAGRPAEDTTRFTDCATVAEGLSQICTRWEDSDFDASANHYYYARVLETPSCRWSQRACVGAGVQCDDPASIPEGYEACCSATHRPVIQERAWSSPIWIKAGAAQ